MCRVPIIICSFACAQFAMSIVVNVYNYVMWRERPAEILKYAFVCRYIRAAAAAMAAGTLCIAVFIILTIWATKLCENIITWMEPEIFIAPPLRPRPCLFCFSFHAFCLSICFHHKIAKIVKSIHFDLVTPGLRLIQIYQLFLCANETKIRNQINLPE